MVAAINRNVENGVNRSRRKRLLSSASALALAAGASRRWLAAENRWQTGISVTCRSASAKKKKKKIMKENENDGENRRQ
jgi:hypothetical protein